MKGHQDDDDEDYNDLSMEAQLNVDADELEELHFLSGTPSRPQTQLLLSCPAILTLRGITITNDYRRHLMQAYTKPAYIGYLQDKFNWSNWSNPTTTTMKFNTIERTGSSFVLCLFRYWVARETEHDVYCHNRTFVTPR